MKTINFIENLLPERKLHMLNINITNDTDIVFKLINILELSDKTFDNNKYGQKCANTFQDVNQHIGRQHERRIHTVMATEHCCGTIFEDEEGTIINEAKLVICCTNRTWNRFSKKIHKQNLFESIEQI